MDDVANINAPEEVAADKVDVTNFELVDETKPVAVLEEEVEKSKMGRPRLPLNWELVKTLAQMQMPMRDIHNITGFSDEGLRKRCLKDHGMTLREFCEAAGADTRKRIRAKLVALTIDNPDPDPGLVRFVAKTMGGLKEDAETQVNTHIEVNTLKVSKEAAPRLRDAFLRVKNQMASKDASA